MIKKLMAEDISEIFGGQLFPYPYQIVPTEQMPTAEISGRRVALVEQGVMILDTKNNAYINRNGMSTFGSGDVFTHREADEFLGSLLFGACYCAF